MSRATILEEVNAERDRQETKWGEQNHPSFFPDENQHEDYPSPEDYGLIPADVAKGQCDILAKKGMIDWAAILIEEVAEALEEPEGPELREELIQVAAVAVSWVECMDRRAGSVETIEG